MARPRHFKPVFSFPNRVSVKLISQIEKHRKILPLIQSAVPDKLADQILDCVVNDRKLLIFISSANWASQLRFYSQSILKAVNSGTAGSIDKVQMRIVSLESTKPPLKKMPEVPSKENIELIRSVGKSAPEGDLKRALLSLSDTLKRCYNAATRD